MNIETINDIKLKDISLISNKNKKLYPIIFKWEECANKVYLTGSFCEWITFYEMEKLNNNNFIFILFLEKGIYQFKFIVDNKWKCNSNLPTCNDKNGNINNFININENKFEEITTDFSTSTITENNYLEDDYDNEIYFHDIINLNLIKHIEETPEEYKCNIKYNLLKKYTNNYSYKKLLPIKNEYINHFNIKTIDKKKRYNIVSCSMRTEMKITTIVYYKPNK